MSLLEGGLSPAIAFTALAIFQRLESTLSLVPELITDFLNAWVSFDRIEIYLNSIERSDTSIGAERVSFQNASVAWPSDEHHSGQFTLHNLHFAFPKHELSIITGPTGSGKSLLLSAIIGESDILQGTIRRPRKDLSSYDQEVNAHTDTWIVPRTIAFVGQTPWIENATLRDNILFGLPFSKFRYTSVLEACGLPQDIATMEKKDLTEVGLHGIGLSGGQRLRLSLARALYSRSETLVLDDVFSAVDAHVGRHLLDYALTGDIVKGRTRIVATHHTRVCLPKASFAVVLGNGSFTYAGHPSQLIRSLEPSKNGLAQIENHFISDSSRSTSESTLNYSEELCYSQHTNIEPNIHNWVTESGIDNEDEAREDSEKEYREKGRIKSSIYMRYMRAASSWPWIYWLVVFGLLIR